MTHFNSKALIPRISFAKTADRCVCLSWTVDFPRLTTKRNFSKTLSYPSMPQSYTEFSPRKMWSEPSPSQAEYVPWLPKQYQKTPPRAEPRHFVSLTYFSSVKCTFAIEVLARTILFNM
ncbi:Bgt-20512 [Blumeria graminis f. sp. tritici]|uniref:Bgt-20512 n=2 Tax=Blumeria graminis f. sp. tritici TaxID=62690 RepID=A0A9X9PQM9_BLUGR|nr:Bgt-20512 [Blumeria graminis f. sp. tritici]